jgi:sterol desaturase/sphingolipid hydroxylase (fatty acid hydroxylase superfamily)
VHHRPARRSWLRQRRYWHALHHGGAGQPCCYGVSSKLWDTVFDSLPKPARRRPANQSSAVNRCN